MKRLAKLSVVLVAIGAGTQCAAPAADETVDVTPTNESTPTNTETNAPETTAPGSMEVFGEHLEALESRLVTNETRLETVESWLAETESQLETVGNLLAETESQLETVGNLLAETESQLETVGNLLAEAESQLEEIAIPGDRLNNLEELNRPDTFSMLVGYDGQEPHALSPLGSVGQYQETVSFNVDSYVTTKALIFNALDPVSPQTTFRLRIEFREDFEAGMTLPLTDYPLVSFYKDSLEDSCFVHPASGSGDFASGSIHFARVDDYRIVGTFSGIATGENGCTIAVVDGRFDVKAHFVSDSYVAP